MNVDHRNRTYPNRLKVIRQNAGYEQRYVAKLLGFNNQIALSRWENEKRMPNGTNLIKLCILYDATPKELYPEYHQRVSRHLFSAGS